MKLRVFRMKAALNVQEGAHSDPNGAHVEQICPLYCDDIIVIEVPYMLLLRIEV